MFMDDGAVMLFMPTAVLLAGTEARGPWAPLNPPVVALGLVPGLEPALELLHPHKISVVGELVTLLWGQVDDSKGVATYGRYITLRQVRYLCLRNPPCSVFTPVILCSALGCGHSTSKAKASGSTLLYSSN